MYNNNMKDDYSHVDNNLIYIEENIPGPQENTKEYEYIINAYNSQVTRFCKCKSKCSNGCSCLVSSCGENFITGSDNYPRLRLNLQSKDFKTQPILECNSLCQCSRDCGNRLVQKGPSRNLVIKLCQDGHKGYGLYSNNFIPKGVFVCEYAGEIITRTQSLARQAQNKLENKMNYIYCLNEYSNGQLTQMFIDPSMFGNVGRYMNHSCEPNCIVVPVRVDSPLPKLAIFASIDIQPDEELTFDYGSNNTEEDDENHDTKMDRKKCLCNAKKCKAWMPYDKY